MQKTVSEVLKTIFFYSPFWSAGQWRGEGEAIAPRPLVMAIAPPSPGYATGCKIFSKKAELIEQAQ